MIPADALSDTPFVVIVVPVKLSDEANRVGEAIVVVDVIPNNEFGQLIAKAVPVIPALEMVPPVVVVIAPIPDAEIATEAAVVNLPFESTVNVPT